MLNLYRKIFLLFAIVFLQRGLAGQGMAADGGEMERKENGRFGTLRGFIVDRTFGKPLSDILVRLLDMNGHEIDRARTDEIGRYVFAVRPGPAVVQACMPGREGVERVVVWRQGRLDHEIKPLKVDPSADIPVYAVMRDAVTGGRLAGANMTVRSRRDGSVLFEAVADTNGVVRGTLAYKRYGLNPGIEITLDKEGYFTKVVEVHPEELALFACEISGTPSGALEALPVPADPALPPLAGAVRR